MSSNNACLPASATGIPRSTPMRILIVTDDDVVREELERFLPSLDGSLTSSTVSDHAGPCRS